MTKEHVFGCRPASRLEQVDDEHSERTQEAIFEQNHRMIANDVCKPMEGQILQKSPAEAGLPSGRNAVLKRDHHSLAESSKCVQIDVAFIPHASDPHTRAM
jgi:hypothetical protein